MRCSTLIQMFLAGGLASAKAIPRALSEDEIIVFGKGGRVEVMNKTSYALLSSPESPVFNLTSSTPTTISTIQNAASKRSPGTGTVDARCSKETIYSMNPVSSFLNWDVIMSSVVHASTGDASVAVTAGYSITNTIDVSVSTSLTLIENYLSTTYSIDYSQSWSSSYSAGYTFTVPSGKYGAVVSNPLTTRHSGSVDIGCVGYAETTTFQADSYSSKSYGDLSWVEGTISLCTSTSYPMPMCIGSGTLS
jgi:hypothetical protein